MSIQKNNSSKSNLRRTLSAYIVSTLLILLDQASKMWIDSSMSETDSITLIPGFLFFDKSYNRGAAFSFMAGRDWGIYLLSGISVIAGIFFLYLVYRASSRLGKILFSFLAAGTIGNGIDRVLKGYVLDFIDAHFGLYIFPTFNVADCYLTVTILLLFILVLTHKYDLEKDLNFKFEHDKKDGKRSE